MIVTGLIGSICAVILLIWLTVEQQQHKKEIIVLKADYEAKIDSERKKAVQKSKDVTRGHISQEFIPLFPDFPYNMSDCRHLGGTIDYIVYDGLTDLRDGKDSKIKIIFADCKVNFAQLSKVQKGIKEAINNNNISFEEWIIKDCKLKIKK